MVKMQFKKEDPYQVWFKEIDRLVGKRKQALML
jgi:hypothetical protein